MPSNYKIMVVCSGCTDRTIDVVRHFQAIDNRIEAVVEANRKGKANALNRIFKAAVSYNNLILVNADAIPEKGSVNTLISQLSKTNAGIVFAQPVPFQEPKSLCYGIVKSIWRLHHFVSLKRSPKLSGELCAIRTECLQAIPEHVATDEPYIELAVREKGYAVKYAPNAIVHIRCPTNLGDLIRQRRRIWIGHMQLKQETDFEVSTSSFQNILSAISDLSLTEAIFAFLGGLLEIVAYLQAKLTYKKNIPFIWDPIKSTKIQYELKTDIRC